MIIKQFTLLTDLDFASTDYDAIKDFYPGKDFHLSGYSFGACVAQEMALQIQEEGYSKSLLSLTFLDGNHRLVPKFLEQMQIDGYGELDILRLFIAKPGEKEEDLLEEAGHKLLLFRPDMTISEARTVCQGSLKCYKLGGNYQPPGNYQGDITLVLSESSCSLPGIESDCGLAEVCSGKVTVKVVPGSHISFLIKESGAQVASILNNVFCPENES